ncbi:Psi-producing oxygenase A [Paramyrothecium foliicola]|nr:Psi-producing oxygenase A [Paramyrothecium foliicola]
MSFDEKFQEGESYGDAPIADKTALLDDPVKIATSIFKDYAAARSATSLPELIGLVQSLLNEGEPSDDRKGNTESMIGILSALPATSSIRTQLTHKLIDTLWNNLQHPPLSYVGGDVKYEVVSGQGSSGNDPKQYDTIEFEAPDTGILLREEIPRTPNGLHHYRMPDGSFNNILEPHLGRAGSPYAKSVRSSKRLHGVRPDAGQLFDLLMARDEDTFRENPAGISSMLFYHASIIIHDIFRTSRTDMNKSDTSSYLDLAPLYGSSLRDQLAIRTMKEGKLKPDTFHEKRLLGQPAGVNVMLVLYNRLHNYVAEVLLKINEGGRFTLALTGKASTEDRAKALAKQDHDLFNTARLIVCGMYASIALGDYLRAIMNLHHTNTDWSLDPRMEIGKQYDGEGVPRGVGNQVSVEFNLLYRFHSCISKKDEKWINDFFLDLFPDRHVENLQDISMPELGEALLKYEKSIPVDPSKRTFAKLERQSDGKFKNEDLVRILKEAMEDPAGSFGSRMVPKALRIIEIQGISQARKWGCASLNEFREFFGLKRYEKFSDITSDEEIAYRLEKIYTDPDMVEMYPGIMIEDTKPMRNPGAGLCPTYTVGRAVLADAITLVRSDRFLTLDYTVSNLTAWGMNEVQGDPKTLGGSMLYKLIQRGLPGWFPYNSIAVMQPMFTKKANIEIAKELGTIDQYTLDDPRPPKIPVFITTKAGIKQILGDHKTFPLGRDKVLSQVFNMKKDISWFMLAGNEPRNFEHRTKTTQAFGKLSNLQQTIYDLLENVGADLLKKADFQLKEGLHQIDIIRDIAIPLNARFLADLCYFDLRSEENPEGTLSVAELYKSMANIRILTTNNSDAAEAWNRRRRAAEGAKVIIDSTRKLVDEVVSSRGFGLGISSALHKKFSRQAYIKNNSLRSLGFKLVDALLAQGNSSENVVDQLWLMAFGGIGVLVTTFYEILEFFLRPENQSIWNEVQDIAREGDLPKLRTYVAEAQRLTSPLRIIRSPAAAAEVEGKQVGPDNVLILNIANAGRDPANVPDADKFDPTREQPEVGCFSTGQHESGLKNLRKAPGPAGEVKIINVGFEKIYLNDNWSHFAFNASTWKVQFDGYGKNDLMTVEDATSGLEMQQYYFALQKRKEELKGDGSNSAATRQSARTNPAMEPVGLAVGVIGLAGLFSSCLEAIDKIQSYLAFQDDNHVLDTRFAATRLQLERWGRRVGFHNGELAADHHPALDDADISATVRTLVNIIKIICNSSDTNVKHPKRANSGLVIRPHGPLQPRAPLALGSKPRKLAWALWGKDEREEQVNLFRDLVQELHGLVPMESTFGHERTNERAAISSV